MNCSLENKLKKELFVSLFYNLKNCSTILSLVFKKEGLFIQGMDKSHVCMYEVFINKNWFHTYENDVIESVISLDSQTFFSVLNVVNDGYKLVIYQNFELKDNLNIDLIVLNEKSGEFSKFFSLPLAETDFELFTLPNIEYEVDFSIDAKKMCEITNQLLLFGTELEIICNEEKIQLGTNGISGNMLVNISLNDLREFSIAEGEYIILKYSLSYLAKMCLSNKLSNEIEFSLSGEYPMRISYDLGENSSLKFYIAPKISD
jgi:proliferating cell nuclear antigen